MNVVWVTAYVPYPPRDGGSIRVFQLARRLARRHAVRVLALDQDGVGPEAAPALARLGVALETFPLPKDLFPRRWSRRWWAAKVGGLTDPAYFYHVPALAERVRAVDRGCQADVVLLETMKMHRYGAGVRRPTVFSRQNYEPNLANRIARILPMSRDKVLWHLGGWLVERAERRICRRFRSIVAVSEREAAIFRGIAPEADVAVVPNGVDLERFTPAPDGAREDVIGLSGLMSYLPNRDSALYFQREIWPHVVRDHPRARVVVMGHQARAALPQLAGVPGFEVHEPGDDIVSALAAATVVAVPLRAGAGTRIKVLEALAMGKPVVSTSVGCEGLELVPGRDVLIADRPEEFAQAIVRILREPMWRREVGGNGRKLVESRYGWDRCAETLETVCARVATRASARRE